MDTGEDPQVFKRLITKEGARERSRKRKKEAQIQAAALEGFSIRSSTTPISTEAKKRALSSSGKRRAEGKEAVLREHNKDDPAVLKIILPFIIMENRRPRGGRGARKEGGNTLSILAFSPRSGGPTARR